MAGLGYNRFKICMHVRINGKNLLLDIHDNLHHPDKIIRSIGPAKHKMYVFGYMDDKVTSIPNNQMLFIITWEFHNTKWWVGSAYSQDNTPFPKRDYVGEICELTIE